MVASEKQQYDIAASPVTVNKCQLMAKAVPGCKIVRLSFEQRINALTKYWNIVVSCGQPP